MKIEIDDKPVESRQITLKSTGELRTVYYQNVYIHKGKEIIKARITLPSSTPYSVGMYTLSDDAYQVSQYGDLQINRYEIRLIPIPEAVPTPPASDESPASAASGSSSIFGRKTA